MEAQVLAANTLQRQWAGELPAGQTTRRVHCDKLAQLQAEEVNLRQRVEAATLAHQCAARETLPLVQRQAGLRADASLAGSCC